MELDGKLVNYRYKGELIPGIIIKYYGNYYLLNNIGYFYNEGLTKGTVFDKKLQNTYKYYSHIIDLENIEIILEVCEVWN